MPKGNDPRLMDGLKVKILHHWATIKADLMVIIIHLFINKRMLHSLYLALLTIIPKNTTTLVDYRSISRLMVILSVMIAKNQAIFVRGTRISDAVGLALDQLVE